VLEVADTGTGIGPGDLPHIFDRFHRVEGARSRTHEGTGIGLALVQELAKMHGGHVTAESDEGRGSTFRVTVPLGTAHLPRERLAAPSVLPSSAIGGAAFVEEALGWLSEDALPPTVSSVRPGGARARIVWADDNRDMRDYVRRLLAEHYDVEAVTDGEAALAAARRSRPDLVLSDVMMPGIGGQGLVRALRADPTLRELSIVLLSARADEEARIEALGDGADDYLVKPFSARELLAHIDARLQITRLQTEALASSRASAAELRASDQRKNEFLAILSHELRNPLVPLRNGLELLRRGHERGVDTERVVDMMSRQLGQLVRLVDDLLQISRIDRGTLELRPERVTLASVVGSAVETSEPLIKEGGHQLEVSLPGSPVWLDGDPVRLAQILSNLLTNAAHYTPTGGQISLSAELRGAKVAVSVIDTGVGFESDAAPELFEMFRRGPGSKGLGLGLAIAQRLGVLHGGTLEAASDGPGRGARFTLVLPTANAPADAVARPAASAGAVQDRILVIDDDRDVADSVAMVLEGMGAEVRVAYGGPQGLALLRDFDPKFVLLDLGMPGMDGYAVAEAIRSRFPDRRPILVALTGFGHDAELRRAREAGFEHHLVKPAEIGALQAIFAAGAHLGSP
jgi:signal transduction histidine kinase